MKAVVITRLGGPEVLEIRDVPEPVPNAGEELVRVEAAGVNFADTLAAGGGYPGTPQAMRLQSFQCRSHETQPCDPL